jgi:hypothetical protein
MPAKTAPWWERPWLVAALALVSAIPLLWPDVPPLTDVPGHTGHYKVQLDLARSPALQQFFSYKWGITGNLGVDLLLIPLAPLLGLEPAVKAIVVTIPMLTVLGFLLTAREVHGRLPPTAFFAVPLAYSFPFHFGFVNYALSMALAFNALALWLWLGRTGRMRLRAALFLPISMALWTAHTFGWAALSLMLFAIELVRAREAGQGLARAACRAALACLPLAPPLALMLIWRSGDVGGGTSDFLRLGQKLEWLVMALRDRWRWFDLASLALLAGLIGWSFTGRSLRLSRPLAAAAAFMLLAFLLLPRKLFGSGYADMRLAPYVWAVAVLAIGLPPERAKRLGAFIALSGLLFVGVRTAATTRSLWLYDRVWDRELDALNHVPRGARLVSFAGTSCRPVWAMTRLEHLPGLAIVRREAFANDQWPIPGALLLRTEYPHGAPLTDPSQFIPLGECGEKKWRSLDVALGSLPPGQFDYVWLIAPPSYDPELTERMQLVWQNGASKLLRVRASGGLKE